MCKSNLPVFLYVFLQRQQIACVRSRFCLDAGSASSILWKPKQFLTANLTFLLPCCLQVAKSDFPCGHACLISCWWEQTLRNMFQLKEHVPIINYFDYIRPSLFRTDTEQEKKETVLEQFIKRFKNLLRTNLERTKVLE